MSKILVYNPRMKLLIDIFPLLLFFAAFKYHDIYVATAVLMAGMPLQLLTLKLIGQRIQTIHIAMLGAVLIFGGLTLLLRDDSFIKWKPTITYWAFGIAIVLTQKFGKKPALAYVLDSQISLPTLIWHKLDIYWSGFCAFLGVLNLYFAFYHNPAASEAVRTATWVNFKVFGIIGLTIVFLLVQSVLIFKNLKLLPKSKDNRSE